MWSSEEIASTALFFRDSSSRVVSGGQLCVAGTRLLWSASFPPARAPGTGALHSTKIR